MKLVLLGAPGAGKGTIAGRIKDKLGIPQFSTGDMIRAEMKNNTEWGQMIKKKYPISEGKLVPDEVITAKVAEKLEKLEGVMLDGFPRTISQAIELDKLVQVDKAILFDVPDETIIKRLTARRQCSNCKAIFNVVTLPPKEEGICDKCGGRLIIRDDDKEDVIKDRLKIYHEQTSPLVDYYEKQGKLFKVDASRTPEEIAKDVLDELGQ